MGIISQENSDKMRSASLQKSGLFNEVGQIVLENVNNEVEQR